MVVCSNQDCLQGLAGALHYQLTVALNGLSIVCYALLWLFLKVKNNLETKNARKVFKSILAVMLANLFGQTLSGTVRLLLSVLSVSPAQQSIVLMCMGHFTTLIQAHNMPILYIFRWCCAI
ncbi:hypothetical protein niasHT_023673 [Heterodera trifolii]|uniref:Uncharacterized protein n=1 Tax=Heterodera trifolii TaxID=157864 RepID=A0ABD2JUQ4_9BILA